MKSIEFDLNNLDSRTWVGNKATSKALSFRLNSKVIAKHCTRKFALHDLYVDKVTCNVAPLDVF